MNIMTKLSMLFTNFIEQVPQYSWRGVFEHTKRINGFLIRISLIASDHLTTEIGLAAIDLSRKVYRLSRKSGLLYTALHLKQCSVALQRYYGGNPIINEAMTVRIALTRTGLPCIIPRHLRKIIRLRNERSDQLVKLYLSWFTLAKIIQLAKRISSATWKSLITADYDENSFRQVFTDIKGITPLIKSVYLPDVRALVLEKGIKWTPTWKATPNDQRTFDAKARSSILTSVKFEIASFARDVAFVHSRQDGFFSPGIMVIPSDWYPFDHRWNREVLNSDLEHYERAPFGIGHRFAMLEEGFASSYLKPGRIAQCLDGGGKRRLFAIGNYIKQCCLRPVHDWAMKVLSMIPMDGTFNQVKPIHRLQRRLSNGVIKTSKFYSYDLKSATDRFPLGVIYTVFSVFFGPHPASSVVNGCLGLNSFDISSLLSRHLGKRLKPSLVSFVRGQPLGYYSSWPLFTLSHHVLVWVAAERYFQDERRFTDYALLGDDIVILHDGVAESYRALLQELGVEISLQKSLVSTNGSLEFAKRFFVKDLKIDLSPISAKAVLTVRSSVGLAQLAIKYGLNFRTILRLSGAGYRVLGRLTKIGNLPLNNCKTDLLINKKWIRLAVICAKSAGGGINSFEWWVGRGYPLNPYFRGLLIHFLIDKLKPKQLKPINPEETFEGEMAINEATVLRNWLSRWLKWLLWYAKVSGNGFVSFDELFDAPIVETSPYRTEFDITKFKFGLAWKCFDMWDIKWLTYSPPSLISPEMTTLTRAHLKGGSGATQFLMFL